MVHMHTFKYQILYIHIYIDIVQNVELDIGTQILMSKCFDHGTTIPDTHIYAYENGRLRIHSHIIRL